MKKILIIDDEMSVCEMLTRFLAKNGYDAESTIYGKQGLQLLKEHNYDLLLCDYRLKDYDGNEYFKEIRKIRPDVTVIFITGYVNLKIAVDLIKDGAYQYRSEERRVGKEGRSRCGAIYKNRNQVESKSGCMGC